MIFELGVRLKINVEATEVKDYKMKTEKNSSIPYCTITGVLNVC